MELNLDALPDGVVRLDAEGRAVDANAAAAALLGPLDDAPAGSFGEAFSVRTGAGEPALRDGVGDVAERSVTLRRTDGEDVELTLTARSAPDGGAVVCLRPVGDRSGIAIVSTVSHELRSPLTSVKGYVSLMLNRWERLDDEKKRTMLEQVHHDADRVTRLVTELLDISRLETGRLVLRREMIDLGALARTVVEKVGMAYPDLECSIDVPGDLPRVYADPDKIEQVLTNLVENAAKYGDPVGMRIAAGVDGNDVWLSVTDRGEGIPEEDLERVFTKFFRRDHGRPSGTGLGLWISRGLIESHDGTLTARSPAGEGATFEFRLPADAFERLHPAP